MIPCLLTFLMNLMPLKHQNASICQTTQHHIPKYDYVHSKTSAKQLNWREVNFAVKHKGHLQLKMTYKSALCSLLSDTHSILSVTRSIQIFYTEDEKLCTSENDNLNLHVQSFRCFPAWSLKFRSLKHSNNN